MTREPDKADQARELALLANLYPQIERRLAEPDRDAADAQVHVDRLVRWMGENLIVEARGSAAVSRRTPPDIPAPAPGQELRADMAAPTVAPHDDLAAVVDQDHVRTMRVAYPAGLLVELKTLRKGRGIFVAHIGERVGPALRALSGVADDANTPELRRRVSERLERLAAALPDDLRVAALVGLGLHPDARLPFYQERIRWLAEFLQRDERTARRRADEAIEQLADFATSSDPLPMAGQPAAADDWYVDELRCVLVLDRPVPEVFEYRKITAIRGEVSELSLSFTPPGDPAARNAPAGWVPEMVYGGVLMPRYVEVAGGFDFVLEFPSPLKRHESTEFELRYSLPPSQQAKSQYVLVTRRQCDLFDLRVRFDRDRPPQQVWQVAETFHHDLDEGAIPGQQVPLDAAGEIHLQFRNLRPGLSYGAHWLDP
jgi:hypothetical protein